jgi:DNA-binding response OmpR family regulator
MRILIAEGDATVDLLTPDIRLPKLCGFEVLKQLRARRENRRRRERRCP